MWIIIILMAVIIIPIIIKSEYKKLETAALNKLGFLNWDIICKYDEIVIVKSRQALQKYDKVKYFKEDKDRLEKAEKNIEKKNKVSKQLREFLVNNTLKSQIQYKRLEKKIDIVINNADAYRVLVKYITSAGNNLDSKEISIRKADIDRFKNNPSLLMGKGEYNKYLKEQQKEALDKKHHSYYDKVNKIVDFANENRDSLIISGSRNEMDRLINQLFDRTVNSIKKVKTIDSEEWNVIGDFIARIEKDIEKIVDENQKILEYYESSDFEKIKSTCEALMSTQREFNEYINEKVQSISTLFGTRVTRNETENEDVNNYIRPYKKSITPFTAEVSSTVFASAENSPLEYVLKYFYPNKSEYPEQIQKLYQLVEELETLKDAKQIIENYKKEYQKYLTDVPDYVMNNDESGFYTRLGFANIDENVLTVEYKFSYTSNGGMAQRSFTVPMTEETIVDLIKLFESKLTASAFAKEQRNLMTKKLREQIKKRDNFTCCTCGNSTYNEPNLLLEIDHIIPVAKGGCTTEDNLQTLCWKCNRAKSDKIVESNN
jgi:uncharacterized protein YoxC